MIISVSSLVYNASLGNYSTCIYYLLFDSVLVLFDDIVGSLPSRCQYCLYIHLFTRACTLELNERRRTFLLVQQYRQRMLS
jgi:hypothetical protein